MASTAFLFNAKQWLGDEAVLLMDWDTRAVHLHLMCLSWQQAEPGTLPNDERLLRKWVGDPPPAIWAKRIFPQLLRAWKVDGALLRQEGLIRENERQKAEAVQAAETAAALARLPAGKPAAKGRKKKVAEAVGDPLARIDGEVADPDADSGFSLNSLLASSSDMFQRVSEEERANIWTMGTTLLRYGTFDDAKARAFLGKQIQAFGEKRVAEAIAQMSLKPVPPAEAKSFFVGLLKGVETKKKRRGGVAL